MTTLTQPEYLKSHQHTCKLLADTRWRKTLAQAEERKAKQKLWLDGKSRVTHIHKTHGLVLIFDDGDYAPFVWDTETSDWRILSGMSGTQARARNDFKPVKNLRVSKSKVKRQVLVSSALRVLTKYQQEDI